ncbi:hypothetical protein [Aporhodopirellula aestuarii]|uniref:Transmembrane protein n=1 Tax=Aporhodopirellula aestuarii TaxID=2950107 RepID=A0ABT0UBJ1_9BACT|nr:hypothetical protein [Aporhodopirellula aestuarii]MCM2374389.1 hypothetical protein [Aporhodopirellula aestuarii]
MSFNPSSSDSVDNSETAGIGNQQSTPTTLSGLVRVGQIISFAMVTGVITISVVFAMLLLKREEPPHDDVMLVALGGGVFVMALGSAFFLWMTLRSAAVTKLHRHPEVAELLSGGAAASQSARDAWENWDQDEALPPPLRPFLGAMQTSCLVAQAVLEGAAIANLVLALIDGNALHFVFVLFSLVGIAALTPTTGKMRGHIRAALSLREESGDGFPNVLKH